MMKLITMTAAGLLAASALAPVPAEAQSRGWTGYDRSWQDGRGYHRDDRRYRNNRRWNNNRRYRAPRARSVCRWERSYYGRVQRCFRVYR